MRLKNILIVLLTLSIALLAQTKKPAKSADKKADGPTPVTGKPTTTSSGLEYWDIKKGSGKLARKARKSACITPAGSPMAKNLIAHAMQASQFNLTSVPAR